MTTRFGVLFFSLICFVILFTPGARAAEPPCEALFTHSAVELANVRPDFAHTTHYTTEVKGTQIRDQCTSSSCWIYSGTSNIEQQLLTATGKTINLSEEYLMAIAMRLKATEALLTPGLQFGRGGSAANVDWLVQNFGIVPTSVWKTHIDIKARPIAPRMMYFLNERVARYHLEAARLTDSAAKATLLETAKKEVLALIESYTGALPEAFEYDGVKYDSPEDYAEKVLPHDNRITIRLTPKYGELPDGLVAAIKKIRPRQLKKNSKLIPSSVTSREMPVEQIGQKIVEALGNGESVRMGYESVNEFVDEKSGIMSIGAFYIPKGFEPPPREYREGQIFQGTGHAVEIVGVDVDADGKIIKFKIKNSHGKFAGDHGYYHMYWDYFAAFVDKVYIREPR